MAVQRWVDGEVSDNRFRVPQIAALPLVLGAILLAFFGVGISSPLAILVLAISVAWATFVVWRYLKIVTKEGDDNFDKVVRFEIPPEYADSESSLKAQRRRKRER